MWTGPQSAGPLAVAEVLNIEQTLCRHFAAFRICACLLLTPLRYLQRSQGGLCKLDETWGLGLQSFLSLSLFITPPLKNVILTKSGGIHFRLIA